MSKSQFVGSKDVCDVLNVDKVGLHYIRKAGLIPFETSGKTHIYDLDKVKKVREFAEKLAK